MTAKTVLSVQLGMETISIVIHSYTLRLIEKCSQGNRVFSKETEKSVHTHILTFGAPWSILKRNKAKETYVRSYCTIGQGK